MHQWCFPFLFFVNVYFIYIYIFCYIYSFYHFISNFLCLYFFNYYCFFFKHNVLNIWVYVIPKALESIFIFVRLTRLKHSHCTWFDLTCMWLFTSQELFTYFFNEITLMCHDRSVASHDMLHQIIKVKYPNILLYL